MGERAMSRRGMLRLLGLGGFSFLMDSCKPFFIPDAEQSRIPAADQSPVDVEIALTAIPDRIQIFPGELTTVWRYKGELISGPPDTLVNIPNSYLGPIINVKRGQLLRVHFRNELPEPSIIHWHGLHVPPAADGHPRLVIDQGESYVYEFEVKDRAGTYWYHPHPHSRTGPQVYAGLAGLFIVSDQEESGLNLPDGEFDLPLVIQDRDFNQNNQLVYSSGHMMDRMVGFLGRQILVNGKPQYELSAAARPYRLRLLNGSNARIYKLAWDDGTPLTIIGTDGGLLADPVQREYVTLAPAQRIELLADFSGDLIGSKRNLISLPFDGFGGQETYSVLRIQVEEEAKGNFDLPESLSDYQNLNVQEAVNYSSPRSFLMAMGQGMSWTINKRTFDMKDVARDEVVKLNDLEVWEFQNQPGSGMGMMGAMSLPHPMHLHGLQFQILEREIAASSQAGWKTLSDGYVDEGWHDTVLVYPGEKVRILVKFEDFTGLYLYHCHNLEHEDMGMMRNYRVDPA